MKTLALKLIRFYQRYFSIDQGLLGKVLQGLWISEKGVCRFSPTCSEYTYQAIEKYGFGHGTILGLKRIVRCHPFSKGGFDPLP
ncbi:membrane protein insertion efficiency factor YidD [candidate division WWE3 bacterium CG06_land_8_20_14_3_00_42_16]|uniref:Putative membrane protein insertion efficiency factor n=4 Tax=Katanobacteria TaxID=422282 RepID=A0A2M7AML5_UNCKA|nr:MAG: membrane protein insertion efficiency factor YidD [bacterium CG1_02_42_9]PIU68594.1 MAG: membrane protein insertion efficiency factor YidD [candidate division WWE3 bacterium CG06_land_8_20_14_3_00_42_16]PIZ42621.1 MAG: membrane protein insertion efficiency factor YidD [candidate division WWE3 bacterium CG_4_10_14_0_2_um_filter_42_8]PJA37512.1 MAG: membrane protein insertion efficiency factor YidD [candidate division WWE3 bacterium CG_4_9_14_3_um_filter_43_9]PJC68799.1 MAG: membrane prot